MRRRLLHFRSRGASRPSRGFTLLEVVIGVAVLGLILASIPPVLLMITHAQYSWNEQRIAESLVRNQVEYLKVTDYDSGIEPEYPSILKLQPDLADGTYRIDVEASSIDGDNHLQEIIIEVYHVDDLVLETKTYKVDRLSS